MRTRIVALTAIASAGCAHLSSSEEAGIAIEVDARGCLAAASPDVQLHIRNASNTRVSFHSYGQAGPPYRLYPGSVQLLADSSGEPWQVVLEHFEPATHEVALGPGDETDFTYAPSVWPSIQETDLFTLRVRDVKGRFHYSSTQGACHPGSAPTISLKPSPLRGSA